MNKLLSDIRNSQNVQFDDIYVYKRLCNSQNESEKVIEFLREKFNALWGEMTKWKGKIKESKNWEFSTTFKKFERKFKALYKLFLNLIEEENRWLWLKIDALQMEELYEKYFSMEKNFGEIVHNEVNSWSVKMGVSFAKNFEANLSRINRKHNKALEILGKCEDKRNMKLMVVLDKDLEVVMEKLEKIEKNSMQDNNKRE